ncbi:hypothetical protein PPERSA_07847 [Pseudocohnilembus persalinus]|uniref:PapD-like protein n=1 Tax=Pseudocohnilembus persalinus TaxID=266149 RepID=A0A0V0QC83_PSEPJ|nr:hypothetical protein PPERSA_07847 [Pseudocohnilembus persalinus]|eukprot:KRW99770.1 hypothetical protein PPERSA_07847 [Pseudocohnilembus persalinus]
MEKIYRLFPEELFIFEQKHLDQNDNFYKKTIDIDNLQTQNFLGFKIRSNDKSIQANPSHGIIKPLDNLKIEIKVKKTIKIQEMMYQFNFWTLQNETQLADIQRIKKEGDETKVINVEIQNNQQEKQEVKSVSQSDPSILQSQQQQQIQKQSSQVLQRQPRSFSTVCDLNKQQQQNFEQNSRFSTIRTNSNQRLQTISKINSNQSLKSENLVNSNYEAQIKQKDEEIKELKEKLEYQQKMWKYLLFKQKPQKLQMGIYQVIALVIISILIGYFYNK